MKNRPQETLVGADDDQAGLEPILHVEEDCDGDADDSEEAF